ncbi:MAG: hypothetical protein ABIA04_13640 [Pseudomonadota bacterium]
MNDIKRFGEYLVKSNIIKRHDLIIALEKQKLFGGKIGENLIDLGCFSSDEMLTHLKTYHTERLVYVN